MDYNLIVFQDQASNDKQIYGAYTDVSQANYIFNQLSALRGRVYQSVNLLSIAAPEGSTFSWNQDTNYPIINSPPREFHILPIFEEIGPRGGVIESPPIVQSSPIITEFSNEVPPATEMDGGIILIAALAFLVMQ